MTTEVERMPDTSSGAEAALTQLRQYRLLRDQLEQMVPDVHEAIRAAYARGTRKADLSRESGISRVWIDNILDNRAAAGR